MGRLLLLILMFQFRIMIRYFSVEFVCQANVNVEAMLTYLAEIFSKIQHDIFSHYVEDALIDNDSNLIYY